MAAGRNTLALTGDSASSAIENMAVGKYTPAAKPASDVIVLCERHFSMGKPIALFFACAALTILAGSFIAPKTGAAGNGACAPAYGVDPCSTASIGRR